MIDFSLLPRRNKTYAGANGSKIAVMYEDELYMLKFPGIARKNKDMSYANVSLRLRAFRYRKRCLAHLPEMAKKRSLWPARISLRPIP